eukprot:467025_1
MFLTDIQSSVLARHSIICYVPFSTATASTRSLPLLFPSSTTLINTASSYIHDETKPRRSSPNISCINDDYTMYGSDWCAISIHFTVISLLFDCHGTNHQ